MHPAMVDQDQVIRREERMLAFPSFFSFLSFFTSFSGEPIGVCAAG